MDINYQKKYLKYKKKYLNLKNILLDGGNFFWSSKKDTSKTQKTELKNQSHQNIELDHATKRQLDDLVSLTNTRKSAFQLRLEYLISSNEIQTSKGELHKRKQQVVELQEKIKKIINSHGFKDLHTKKKEEINIDDKKLAELNLKLSSYGV